MEGLINWLDSTDSRLVHVVMSMLMVAVVSLVVRFALFPVARWLVRRTGTTVDDQILDRLTRPIVATIVLVGLGWSLLWLEDGSTLRYVIFALLKTVGVILWAVTLSGCGVLILESLMRLQTAGGWIQPKTVPLFAMIWKILIYGGAVYYVLQAWHINVATWLASAGVMGIAVGFAAKDSLANLFAGVFILADAPYEIGDFIIIDGDTRGEVTDIGLRSSRILTRDDVEVTVPNAVIANAKIINETRGPHRKMRVRIQVSVAYGTDVEHVRSLLLGCARDIPDIAVDPEPRVRFRMMADSGLQFELLACVNEPVLRGRAVDALNERAYSALREAGVEIPYPQVDLHVRDLPK